MYKEFKDTIHLPNKSLHRSDGGFVVTIDFQEILKMADHLLYGIAHYIKNLRGTIISPAFWDKQYVVYKVSEIINNPIMRITKRLT